MKQTKYTPFGECYTIEMVKADSDRALIPARKRIIDRLLAKLHSANAKYHGNVVKCVLAVAAITILSFNGFA